MTIKVTCPHCGSANIAELSRAIVVNPVMRFELRDGFPVAAEYGTWETLPDSVETCEEFPYSCRDCEDGAELTAEDLLVAEVAA